MDFNKQTTHYCTRAQALALVNRQPAGTHFAIMIGRDAPIEGKPGTVFPHGLSTCFSISRRDARRLTQAMLGEALEARGARFPITTSPPEEGKSYSVHSCTLAYAARPME